MRTTARERAAPSLKAYRPYILWYLATSLLVALALLPIFAPGRFETPWVTSRGGMVLVGGGLMLLGPLASWFALGGAGVPRERRLGLLGFIVAAVALCELVHYTVVDRGNYHSAEQFADNTAWQWMMHRKILALQPSILPHSYRFLPNAIVEIFRALCGNFVLARIAYRALFNGLLFVGVYRLARVYVSPFGAALAVGLVVVVYPITIVHYGGQFVDPLANGAYAVCLCFLATGAEAGFGPVLFAGLLAKESVIVAAVCRFYYGRTWAGRLVPAALYGGIGVALLVFIRYRVNAGVLHYTSISGVGFRHVGRNLVLWRDWVPLYLVTLGPLLPGTVLGWRHMDLPFRRTTLTVVAACVISSALFSWLSELRNLIPAFVVLAVVNVVHLERSILPRFFPASSGGDRVG